MMRLLLNSLLIISCVVYIGCSRVIYREPAFTPMPTEKATLPEVHQDVTVEIIAE